MYRATPTFELAKGPDGRTIPLLNPQKQYTRHFQLGLDRDGEIVLPPSGTNGFIRSKNMTLDDQLHFEAVKIVGESDGPYNLSIYWQQGNTDLMNKPVDARLIVGNGARPYRLPSTLWMRARSCVKMTFENLSPMPNRIRIWLIGRAIYFKQAQDDARVRRLVEMLDCKASFPFFLSPDQNVFMKVPSSPKDVFPTTLTTDPNYWFEGWNIQGFADNETGYTIQDPTTGRRWSSAVLGGQSPSLQAEALLFGLAGPFFSGFRGTGAGWAEYAYRIEEPILVHPNAKMPIEFADTTGLPTPNRVRFCIAGRYIRPGCPGGLAPTPTPTGPANMYDGNAEQRRMGPVDISLTD